MIIVDFKLLMTGNKKQICDGIEVLVPTFFKEMYGKMEVDDILDELEITLVEDKQTIEISYDEITGSFLPEEEFAEWFTILAKQYLDLEWLVTFFEADSSMVPNRAYLFECKDGQLSLKRTGYFENYSDYDPDEDEYNYKDKFEEFRIN